MSETRCSLADRSQRKSPLALTVLALLIEAPMHAYRMHDLIKKRGKDTVVNVAQRNSVYQTIERLERSGLIRLQGTSRAEGRPERAVYEITDEGSAALRTWLRHMIASPAREFPEFPAALSFIMVLAPKDALEQLEARAKALERNLAQRQVVTKEATARGLPRLFLLEDEYKDTVLRGELKWVRSLIGDLRSKKITWSEAWLRKIAATFGD